MPVIMPRFRHRLALKIVLPFAALTLAMGSVGTVTATGELNSRSQQAFDSQLVHDGFITQSMVQAADVQRPAIFSRAPVHGPTGQQSDDVRVGEYLEDRAARIKAALHDDITYYHINGQVLSTSLPGPNPNWSALALDGASRNRVTPTSVV